MPSVRRGIRDRGTRTVEAIVDADATLVELTTAPTLIEAEWIVGALKARGIRAVVFDAALAAVEGIPGPVFALRVMVRSDEREGARSALAAIRPARPL